MDGGRWVAKTTSILPDGGWVTLYADITQKKAAIEQLERLASIDGLTGLANRRYFDERLRIAVEMASSSRLPVSLLMIDVDHFKAYNDTYGHPSGDQVLRDVAAALQSSCRRQPDIVARYGGEELAVIMPGAPAEVALEVAVRIVEAVRLLEIPHSSSATGRVTISIGVATWAGDKPAEESRLLKSADEALYAAKCAGRDTVRIAKLAIRETVSA